MPAVPVAVKVTGLPPPESPVAVAVSEFGPAVVPRVHELMDAMPVAPVVAGLVPVSDPPPVATAKVTDTPGTGLLFASVTRTAGAVATAVPATALCPSPADAEILAAAPGFTTTEAVWVMATPLIVADTVLVSALVDASVPVVTPRLLVVPGWVRVLPVPLAARITVAPETGFPDASLAVTVMVDEVPPAEMGDEALTVD